MISHLGAFHLATKLYVGNLSYDINQSDLQAMFAEHGSVISAQVIMDRETQKSKGFGFVEMSSEPEAQSAIAALNGKSLNGRALTVNEARPQEARNAGHGGGPGGFGGQHRGPGGNTGMRGPYGLGRGGGNRH